LQCTIEIFPLLILDISLILVAIYFAVANVGMLIVVNETSVMQFSRCFISP